jgi:hypothetical protein
MGNLHKNKGIHKAILRRIFLQKETFPNEFVDRIYFCLNIYFLKIVSLCEMWRNMVQTDTKHIVSHYGESALCAS